MPDFGTNTIGDELQALANQHPHLHDHLEAFFDEYSQYPLLIEEADGEYESDRPNVIYELEDGTGVFAHVYGFGSDDSKYDCIEPTLNGPDSLNLKRARNQLLTQSSKHPAPPQDDDGFREHIEGLIDSVLEVGSNENVSVIQQAKNAIIPTKVRVSQRSYTAIKYHLMRDIAGLGPLEPVMMDPTNEDIHIIGTDSCYVDNGVWGMLTTNISFGEPEEFDNWLRNMGERIDNPVSDSQPIIDNTLPDGSRINIIYSDDISIQGASLTIRQGAETPLSIFQLVAFGTLSAELAAYLWLCLENERTVFVVGETASGKTTTLNAILSFIPRDHKIYTAEDTAEVLPPHDNWQQLITREGVGDEGTEVDMFELVRAALRSRPDYIIVGEVRGEEAQMAFQAAQTGHPVMLTFHASDIKSMIQRFTGNPINIPETFMDNADVALFQNRVKTEAGDVLRRVTSVQEIQGYSKEEDGIITKQAFEWDARTDEINFTGQNNSYVLEEQIAELLGYEDKREIYTEMRMRAEVIQRLVDSGCLGYAECNDAIRVFNKEGPEALNIDLAGLT